MEKKMILNEAVNYFKSQHWQDTIKAIARYDVLHVHTYVETVIHPRSMEKLVVGAMKKAGYYSQRTIDHIAPKKNIGALHGIHPYGCTHWDFHWAYNPEKALSAMDGGELGKNLLVWDTDFMKEFDSKFDYRQASEEDMEVLKEYFNGKQWKDGLQSTLNSRDGHVHINVKTSMNPNIIKDVALEYLADNGWDIIRAVPCVYATLAGDYLGKIVFLSRNPEYIFDIGWKYDASVVIEPAKEVFSIDGQIGYDIWDASMNKKLPIDQMIQLDDEDVQGVLKSL